MRAGRRQTLWRRIRGGAAEHFDVPEVPPTDPKVVGAITLDGAPVHRLREKGFFRLGWGNCIQNEQLLIERCL